MNVQKKEWKYNSKLCYVNKLSVTLVAGLENVLGLLLSITDRGVKSGGSRIET